MPEMLLENVAVRKNQNITKINVDVETTIINNEIVFGHSAYIYIGLRAFENENGAMIPFMGYTKISNEGLQVNESYEAAQDTLE